MASFVDTNLTDRKLLSHEWMMTLFSRRSFHFKSKSSSKCTNHSDINGSPSKQPLIQRNKYPSECFENISRCRSSIVTGSQPKISLSRSAYPSIQSSRGGTRCRRTTPKKMEAAKCGASLPPAPERTISFVSADLLQEDPLREVPSVIQITFWHSGQEERNDSISVISFDDFESDKLKVQDENELLTLQAKVNNQEKLLMGDTFDENFLLQSSSSCSTSSDEITGWQQMNEEWGMITTPLSGEWPSDEDKSPIKKRGDASLTTSPADLEVKCSITWTTHCEEEGQVEAIRVVMHDERVDDDECTAASSDDYEDEDENRERMSVANSF
eukprot:CAMPEP_0198150504 /NCGR_PEP_ID=MMETSP1443-20131203/51204_1 /TAXON_ID=186043 /ORGANISM="Entomoneis sp., Strain CCMP2396" /LENGTH=326 /DNA_ID=CAMNT_0043815829 /DNA_START=99 /DNA_END=1079 /DNA_ORIENTATION=+